MSTTNTVKVNSEIDSPTVRVIGEIGEQLGVMSRLSALAIADARNIDIIEVSPKAKPPVCKLMDYSKFKYEQQKKDKLANKHKRVSTKEIRLHPNIAEHDLAFKLQHARQFLSEGHKVKFNMIFKGREIDHIDLGADLVDSIIEKLSDVAKVEQDIRLEGNYMSITFINK